MESLNAAQQDALARAVAGENVFITGAAGTGKTHLLGCIYRALRARHGAALHAAAATGIAAKLLGDNVSARATTLHSWSGVRFDEALTVTNAYTKRRLTGAKVLLLDEISMLRADYVHRVDKVLRALRRAPDRFFGGIQVISCGDFNQLPPVGDTGQFLFLDKALWGGMVTHTARLTEVIRQRDETFVRLLDEISRGEVSEEAEAAFADKEGEEEEGEDMHGVLPTKLFCRNRDVDAFNLARLRELPGEETVYAPRARIHASNCRPDNLPLKVGAQVLISRNIDVSSGLCNGARAVVTAMHPREVTVRLPSGAAHRITPAETAEGWMQIPLRLAFAITVHRAQGQTIDYLDVDLTGAFEFNQVYTALSRAVSLKRLRVRNFSKASVRVHPSVLKFFNGGDDVQPPPTKRVKL